MILTGRNESTGSKTSPSDTLSTTNPTLTGLALNVDLCGEWLATNHQSK